MSENELSVSAGSGASSWGVSLNPHNHVLWYSGQTPLTPHRDLREGEAAAREGRAPAKASPSHSQVLFPSGGPLATLAKQLIVPREFHAYSQPLPPVPDPVLGTEEILRTRA